MFNFRRVLIITLLLAPTLLAAQGTHTPLSSDSIQPGERVRISAPRFVGGIIDGELEKSNSDTIVVAMRNDSTRLLSVPKNLIIGMYVQRGKKRSVLPGALIGAAVCAGGMALLTQSGGELPGLRNLAIVIAGGGGLVIGGLIGSQIKSDRWSSVRVAPPPRTELGLGLTFTFRF